MAGFATKLGIILFVVGFGLYFLTHIALLSGIVCALGFILIILGFIISSLENGGDISLS